MALLMCMSIHPPAGGQPVRLAPPDPLVLLESLALRELQGLVAARQARQDRLAPPGRPGQ